MVNEMGACVLCNEQITNPLSPQRLMEQMTTWLAESKPELIYKFEKEHTSFLNRDVRSSDYCIFNNKPMDVCVYCFTEHAFHWLEEQITTKEVLNEYISFFNFDVTKQGYTKEYEETYGEIQNPHQLIYDEPTMEEIDLY